ncbi:CRISPR-associated protein Cas5 [Zhenpiania hominis]|uniref:CRISPR-associated protein Cas5 n=1 Tax=Zhenpiania hominis TaxID=2763644 RepID=UPI0039F4815C
MKAIRLKLRQTSANYRREETVRNKMTYPLPPFSTVIGALHKACGYQEYHPMDISIQGKYGSLQKKVYMDHCFLNNTQNDRGILVKMKNPHMLSPAYVVVAQAKKKTGNDFYKGINIDVKNKDLLQEYRNLKELKSKILPKFKRKRIEESFKPKLKKLKTSMQDRKQRFQEDKVRLESIKRREKELSALEKRVKQRLQEYEKEHYTIPYSYFRTLTKGPKYYEILTDVELVIHVRADDEVMQDILDHIYNLKAIGRSEDMVEVLEACMVELGEPKGTIQSRYSAYLDAEAVARNDFRFSRTEGVTAIGTRYYLNKNYKIENGKRVFEKKAVVYASKYLLKIRNEKTDSIYVDYVDGQKGECYIVNFI